ncbi:hypothetical protein T4A_4539 [Trichinella pseudospiralis]|uniref:Uncharacterized protein n=1 Tax=Trichinella pseudospiralis TaxID=6337 RepID=A0A0V1DUQ4_TRIPS|nr:hypothetical protein T4A_4539 [Trichinella pseudospiralis]
MLCVPAAFRTRVRRHLANVGERGCAAWWFVAVFNSRLVQEKKLCMEQRKQFAVNFHKGGEEGVGGGGGGSGFELAPSDMSQRVASDEMSNGESATADANYIWSCCCSSPTAGALLLMPDSGFFSPSRDYFTFLNSPPANCRPSTNTTTTTTTTTTTEMTLDLDLSQGCLFRRRRRSRSHSPKSFITFEHSPFQRSSSDGHFNFNDPTQAGFSASKSVGYDLDLLRQRCLKLQSSGGGGGGGGDEDDGDGDGVAAGTFCTEDQQETVEKAAFVAERLRRLADQMDDEYRFVRLHGFVCQRFALTCLLLVELFVQGIDRLYLMMFPDW